MEALHENTEWFAASKLLDSGEYSDLTINCEDAKFRVHKAIVCAKSPVLATACGHGLQVCCLPRYRCEKHFLSTCVPNVGTGRRETPSIYPGFPKEDCEADARISVYRRLQDQH